MEDPPPGFRFYPTEEELVSFYLHKQLQGQSHHINRVIPLIDINGVEPWNLPTLAGELCRGDSEQWFFFTARQEREARGGRPNRTTACGYWKATGSPSHVYSSGNRVIGIKKTMVFYKGKAPSGRKTKWKLHEYKAIQHSHQSDTAPPKLMQEFSLCRVYVISGSFRSFDRRPVERARHEFDHVASTSVQQVEAAATEMEVDGSCSPVTSHSGGVEGDHGTDGMNWNVIANNKNNGVQFEEPVWDWEQLDWV